MPRTVFFGNAVVRITKEILAILSESPLHSKLELDAKDVFDAALGGTWRE
jgi:hypothetical protein